MTPRPRIRTKPRRPPPDLASLPPLARRIARSGPVATMPADWADPDDIRPNGARVARRVRGLRAYDPIRVMAGDLRSGVTEHHVHAADKVREMVDDARLAGFTGGWLEAWAGTTPGPRSGLRPSQQACVRAAWRLARLWQRFTILQWRRIGLVVLQNETVASWTRLRSTETGVRCDPQFEKGQLIATLDAIWLYFETELADEVDTGRRLPA